MRDERPPALDTAPAFEAAHEREVREHGERQQPRVVLGVEKQAVKDAGREHPAEPPFQEPARVGVARQEPHAGGRHIQTREVGVEESTRVKRTESRTNPAGSPHPVDEQVHERDGE